MLSFSMMIGDRVCLFFEGMEKRMFPNVIYGRTLFFILLESVNNLRIKGELY